MSQPKSVAKITQKTADELGVATFLDDYGNIVVNLDFGDVLSIADFEAIEYVPNKLNLSDGIIPPKRHTP